MDALPTNLADSKTAVPVSSQLAGFAANLRAEDIPADVMEQAKRHMLDCWASRSHRPVSNSRIARRMRCRASRARDRIPSSAIR